MEESIIRGKEIYEEIKKVMTERSELAKACDNLQDDMGTSSMAYKILDKAYKEIDSNLTVLMNKEYKAYRHKPLSLDDF